MSTEHHHIVVRGVRVEIVRKDIRNLHLGVYPPNGRVRVAAPLRVSDDVRQEACPFVVLHAESTWYRSRVERFRRLF